MDLNDYVKLAKGPIGLVPCVIQNNNFAPYAEGEIRGFPPEEAMRLHQRGDAYPEGKGPLKGAKPQTQVMDRSLPVPGAVGTTLLTSEAMRTMSALELDAAMRNGRAPLHAAAESRAVRVEGTNGGEDQSRVGAGSTAASGVAIPENWKAMHHLQRVKLAEAITGSDVRTKDEADGIIEGEVGRRAELANQAGDDGRGDAE